LDNGNKPKPFQSRSECEQFIWKPAPGDLLLRPKPKKHPAPKVARN
jgi:hypothetical protein